MPLSSSDVVAALPNAVSDFELFSGHPGVVAALSEAAGDVTPLPCISPDVVAALTGAAGDAALSSPKPSSLLLLEREVGSVKVLIAACPALLIH